MPVDRVVIVPFSRLTAAQCYAAMAIRNAVFCVEQQITAEPDLDGLDPLCDHVLLHADDRVVGTARLQPIDEPDASAERHGSAARLPAPCIKVGRLAVHADHRGRGYGRAIMGAAHGYLDERALPGVMHAQQHLARWYASLGWRVVGAPFDEAGVPHLAMVRDALGHAGA